MNLEFDPNNNNDRSADGNNLQEIGSLGGEGVLFDRVPGGSQVRAAN
jgi:hypothetical protein